MTETITNAPAGTAITGLDLIGCTVSDLQKSLTFYRDTLGLQQSFGNEGGAEFEFPNGETLGIWKPEGGEYPVGFGVMFTVADVKAAVELCNSRGAKISDVFESPVCKMAMGQDPDGNGFIIHQRTQKIDPVPPPHVKSQTSINGIDWAGYFVGDVKRSLAFYRDVLGLPATSIYESGQGVEFTLGDGTTFGVWRPDGVQEGGKAKGGAMMFAATDAHAKVAQLRERGVQITDVEDTDNCYMAFTRDPDDIAVIIHQIK